MGINWTKKKSTTIKWAAAGPAFLFCLIFSKDMKMFGNGIVEGILLCAIFLLMPAVAVFAVYWPTDPDCQDPSEGKLND